VASSIGLARRYFLYAVTGAMGAVGLGVAAWPLIDQMNPDASACAASDVVDIDLTTMFSDQRVVQWHHVPIFVAKRTPDALTLLQEPAWTAMLRDPDSNDHQQPAYARNWHRSLHPEWSVLVGVCTYCACVPKYFAAGEALRDAGGAGYFCPCCAAKYDLAGRAYRGPARYNLPVPPHSLPDQRTLRIGRNPPGEIFNFESIARI